MNYLKPDWPAPSHIRACTTFRTLWTGRNESIREKLDLPEEPIWLTQVHGNTVVEATQENVDVKADASFTSTPNRVCITLTADCLPVLITDKKGTKVAAIHAGWRGLAAGVIEETIKALQIPADQLLIWFGPAIGPHKYEVGKDVYDAFVTKHASSASAFALHSEGKWLANLYELAKIRLALSGITQIYGGDYCTYTRDDLFFSYRRDKEKTGRMASLIWIEQ